VTSQRTALIVASDDYTDPGLKRLRAPASDARALAAVLSDPEIGGFEVRTLFNEPAHQVNLAVEEFFSDREPGDLLLVHFSCHGVKDEDGELYFAMADTRLRRLGATAVAADFVNRRMSRTRSRRVVLLLDCCYAGAFERGMRARAGEDVAIGSQFGGRGRAVITASSAMEYAFEGDQLTDTREVAPSVFTSALVQGLETGDADIDQDGLVALDELYDYIYDTVRATTPNQTPSKWAYGMQGELVIARRAQPVATPVPLPPELQEATESSLATVRAASVQELRRVLDGRHAGRALSAHLALQRLAEDDSRRVAAAAAAALGLRPPAPELQPTTPELQPTTPEPQPLAPEPQLPEPPRLRLSATAVDFGPIAHHSRSPERRIRLSNAGGGTLNAHATTRAGWLEVRQEGDDLVLAVDTTVAGRLEHTVTIDSDGGSATINVQALVEPAPQPAVTHTEATRAWARPPVPAPSTPAEPGTRPASMPVKRRAWIAIATACVIAVAGVAYFLLGRAPVPSPGPAHSPGHGSTAPPPILALPGCTTTTARAARLHHIRTRFAQVGGKPFDVVVTRSNLGFVSLRQNQPLTIVNTASFAPTVMRSIPMADAEGEAFTHDGQYLLVAGGSGMTVFRVKELEAGLSSPIGSLSSPDGQFALQVVTSPDDKFAFVALQTTHEVAVFNLKKALAQHFGPDSFVGMIPLRSGPTGMALSHDGRYLYVANGLGSIAHRSGMGTLAIVDVAKAEAHPASSVVKTIDAGCGPARVLPSADGKTVWVTVAGANTLAAFSAAKMFSDPSHALIARVKVGQIPQGIALVNNGTRLVVADTNRDSIAGSSSDLAVIDVSKALARRPGALLGTIKSGVTPRQFALKRNGKTLLVTNTGSAQLEAVDVSQLP
jgi:DNA-binding beta-propeller fold protein YncE/uncharacterized caspase-like protein